MPIKALSMEYLLDIKPGKRKVIQLDEFYHVEVGDMFESDQLSIGWYGWVLWLSFNFMVKQRWACQPQFRSLPSDHLGWDWLLAKRCDQ